MKAGIGASANIFSWKVHNASWGFLAFVLSQNWNGRKIKGILQLLYEKKLQDPSLSGGECRYGVCLKFTESQRRHRLTVELCQILQNREYQAVVAVNQ